MVLLSSMRIDSCRNCGNKVQVTKLCQICIQPRVFQCSHCSHYVYDQIHSHGKILIYNNEKTMKKIGVAEC